MSENDAPEPAVLRTPGELTGSAPKKRTKRPTPESLEAFIRDAYAQKGKKLALSTAIERSMARVPSLSPDVRPQLLKVAVADVDLAVALELLLATRKLVGQPPLRNALRDFIGDVLRGHLTFATDPELLAVLNNRPDAIPAEEAFRRLAPARKARNKRKVSQDSLQRSAGPAKHAATVLALWIAETRGLGPVEIARIVAGAVWCAQADRMKSEVDQFRAFLVKPSPAAFGLLVRAGEGPLREASARVDRALHGESRALARVEELKNEVARLLEELRANCDLAARLEERRSELERTLTTERAHWRDDYELLRGRVLQRLRKDVRLMEDGLHALRKNPPKVDVMDDHAERVLEALRCEINNLQSGQNK